MIFQCENSSSSLSELLRVNRRTKSRVKSEIMIEIMFVRDGEIRYQIKFNFIPKRWWTIYLRQKKVWNCVMNVFFFGTNPGENICLIFILCNSWHVSRGKEQLKFSEIFVLETFFLLLSFTLFSRSDLSLAKFPRRLLYDDRI